MKKSHRKTIFTELKKYDHTSSNDDYIEITEWTNGEGFDVDVHSNIPTRFQLTWGYFCRS